MHVCKGNPLSIVNQCFSGAQCIIINTFSHYLPYFPGGELLMLKLSTLRNWWPCFAMETKNTIWTGVMKNDSFGGRSNLMLKCMVFVGGFARRNNPWLYSYQKWEMFGLVIQCPKKVDFFKGFCNFLWLQSSNSFCCVVCWWFCWCFRQGLLVYTPWN